MHIYETLIVILILKFETQKGQRMTHAQRNKKILDAIATETARALSSQKVARATLIKEGIYTKRGKLRAEFGGEKSKGRATA